MDIVGTSQFISKETILKDREKLPSDMNISIQRKRERKKKRKKERHMCKKERKMKIHMSRLNKTILMNKLLQGTEA